MTKTIWDKSSEAAKTRDSYHSGMFF